MEITLAHAFTERDVDRRSFTLSLLSLCSAEGLIPQSRQLEIRKSLDRLFVSLAERYTKHASSSVSKAAAEKLYGSLLYTCDVYLLSLDFEVAVGIVCAQEVAFEDIYSRGEALILDYYDLSAKIFREVYKSRLNVKMPEYRKAVESSFDSFYLHYDSAFAAQDCNADIDYPLLYGNALDCGGVLYIIKYYRGLLEENLLCGCVGTDKINAVIKKNCARYHCGEADLYANIVGLLLDDILDEEFAGKADTFTSEREFISSAEKYLRGRLTELNPNRNADYFVPYARTYALLRRLSR